VGSEKNSKAKQKDTNNNKQFLQNNIIIIISQIIAIILGILVTNAWNLNKGLDYDAKLLVYEQTIASLKRSIIDLEIQNNELYKEKEELRKKQSQHVASHNKNAQKLIDKDENIYMGEIKISFWPEIKGNKFVIDEAGKKRIYPLVNIHSFCFDLVEGNAVINIKTIDGNYKHKLDQSFYLDRKIKLKGTIIRTFNINEISCIVFNTN